MKDEQNIMAELFEPTLLNGMELSNRFVRSATWEGQPIPPPTWRPRASWPVPPNVTVRQGTMQGVWQDAAWKTAVR